MVIVETAPWEIRRHVNGPMADIYSTNRDRYFDCLATTAFHGWTVEEMETHARLIAAAPQMYEALEELCKVLPDSVEFDTTIWPEAVEAWDNGLAALAAVRGES